MTGFFIKLVICPLVVLLANALFDGISYANALQAILVGLLLAVLAHNMELFFLKRGTLWISTAVDFIAGFAVIYLSQFVFRNSLITAAGALYTAILLNITELIQHWFLIHTGRAEKTD